MAVSVLRLPLVPLPTPPAAASSRRAVEAREEGVEEGGASDDLPMRPTVTGAAPGMGYRLDIPVREKEKPASESINMSIVDPAASTGGLDPRDLEDLPLAELDVAAAAAAVVATEPAEAGGPVGPVGNGTLPTTLCAGRLTVCGREERRGSAGWASAVRSLSSAAAADAADREGASGRGAKASDCCPWPCELEGLP